MKSAPKEKPILVGAVIYDPKVSVIWDIIGQFFEANGCPVDTVFYTNYALRVEALRGGYAPLRPYLERMRVDQLVLEWATERAGDVLRFDGKELGLGVVNPRTDRVEEPGEVRAAVERALHLYPPEKLFLNPDCGFGTFSARPLADASTAFKKMRAIAEAARALRAAAGA